MIRQDYVQLLVRDDVYAARKRLNERPKRFRRRYEVAVSYDATVDEPWAAVILLPDMNFQWIRTATTQAALLLDVVDLIADEETRWRWARVR